jgi:hypothetical protein
MSAQPRIAKLQGLLERIKKNAGRPRVVAVGAAPPAVPAARPDPSAAVDDLLDASAAPSPMPLEVDVTLESVPPAAAIPLVSSPSTGKAATQDDALSMDSEVSEVRVTTAMREPAIEVTVAAIAAEAEPIAPEELSEDDLVEVTETTSVPPAVDVDIDFEDEDEQPPASSQRSRVASSMDEALAAAAAQLEAEREVPLKTPPPESGPQAAPLPAGIAAPAAPDVDALLGQELEIPTRADEARPRPEQLGQTIDLEEARGPALELAEPKAPTAPEPQPIEELEITLPGHQVVGGYDDQLQPPPEAQQHLEAHRRRLEEDIPPPPESLAQLPSVQPAAPASVPTGPAVVARPVPAGSPDTFSSVRQAFQPRSFLELLDASLGLNGE